ncbi:MAG: metal-binding protein [Betaproteobacteria bacterium HGW-Betaproteobacteria-3]|jgi:hypothetical protein|nr:MAG: metal-binding protein [Betaproteobacteria bacterium HGW-Betaproteobacteria-3]
MQRRTLIQTAAAMATGALVWPVAAQAKPQVEVWKSPTCGCCKDWVAHMEANGFSVKTYETGNNAVRARLGLPQELGSCHTALVNGYLIEGHVPARDVKRLLAEHPKALGLSVPGMPVGAPGMDGPTYGGRKDHYDVLLVEAGGKTRVYQTYP